MSRVKTSEPTIEPQEAGSEFKAVTERFWEKIKPTGASWMKHGCARAFGKVINGMEA